MIYAAWALVILIGSAFVWLAIAAVVSNRRPAEMADDFWRDAP